jgi:uncharacterized membrane protein/nitrite reductase/ring-hydroxylating ferredoxin subunit
MLRDVLQGKPLRHPLHPLLVHFPVGLFTLTLVLDLVSHAFPGQGFVRAAFYALAAGLIGTLIAAVPGFVDYTGIRDDHPARRTATAHMMLNLLMVGVYAASLGLRWQHLDVSSTPTVPLLVAVAAFVILSISGYLGGRLVYEDGIAVGRHRRKTPTPQHTIGIAAPPGRESELRYVPIAPESELQPGETIRAEVDGTVICIARVDKRIFAFQEFCTHRFGPLSEGCLRGTEIECPWHRSRFDGRTGKVVRGPAKVDLKTWPVEIRDGKICVGIARESIATQPELLPKPAHQGK